MDKTSIVKQLIKDEGFRPKAYWDLKQWTYGYGCRAPTPFSTITKSQALQLLENEVDNAIIHFYHIFGEHADTMNDVRQNAFVNMIFNMGPGRLGRPEFGGLCSFIKMLSLISDRPINWDTVAAEIKNSKWYGQVGSRGKRIVKEMKLGKVPWF